MNVSIEQLAEKLNIKLWVKGDLKRIYLNDVGHNTKKMSTKAFIFEKDGVFMASVKIECPSQPQNWISSQEEEVKETILEDVSNGISSILYPIVEDDEKVEISPAVKEEAKKVKHKVFGKGEVLLEQEEDIKVYFYSVGEKNLSKKGAKLQEVC